MKSRSPPKSVKSSAYWSRRFSRPAKPAKPAVCGIGGVNKTQTPSLLSLPFSELVSIKHTQSLRNVSIAVLVESKEVYAFGRLWA